jgi:thiol:disulfide interchange protein
MKRLVAAVVLALLSPVVLAQEVTPAAQPAKPAIYDTSAKAEEQIAAALARASRDHTRVLIQWGAEWCGWCHLLHQTFKSDRAVARELQYEYQAVLVDIGRWDKHMDLAAQYGAELRTHGVPFLTVLDSAGKVVANRETGSLERQFPQGEKGEPSHDPAKVLEFLKANKAPAVNADDALASALSRAGADDRLVFLHFGAPWCGWCHRLEAWLEKPEVRAIMAKEFIDLKIDTDRMTGGKAMHQRLCRKPGGIPWTAILDSKGAVLAHSGEGDDNFGFPFKDDEIDRFAAMLTTARRHLADSDIAALTQSLRDNAAAERRKE